MKYWHVNVTVQLLNETMTCNCTVVISFFHLKDVGYDGLLPEELGFVNNVINKYFVEYFPRSINTSATLRELGYYEKQIYTTHPWLVRLYLHCPPNLVLSGIKLQVLCNIYCSCTSSSSSLLGYPVLFSRFFSSLFPDYLIKVLWHTFLMSRPNFKIQFLSTLGYGTFWYSSTLMSKLCFHWNGLSFHVVS